jgi:hypothetical protein
VLGLAGIIGTLPAYLVTIITRDPVVIASHLCEFSSGETAFGILLINDSSA